MHENRKNRVNENAVRACLRTQKPAVAENADRTCPSTEKSVGAYHADRTGMGTVKRLESENEDRTCLRKKQQPFVAVNAVKEQKSVEPEDADESCLKIGKEGGS